MSLLRSFDLFLDDLHPEGCLGINLLGAPFCWIRLNMGVKSGKKEVHRSRNHYEEC